MTSHLSVEEYDRDLFVSAITDIYAWFGISPHGISGAEIEFSPTNATIQQQFQLLDQMDEAMWEEELEQIGRQLLQTIGCLGMDRVTTAARQRRSLNAPPIN